MQLLRFCKDSVSHINFQFILINIKQVKKCFYINRRSKTILWGYYKISSIVSPDTINLGERENNMGLFDKLKEPIFYKETSDAKAQLEQLKEFHKNAPEDVKERVEQDIKMLSYGISGEDNVAFELKNSFMPMIILHDLHFECEGITAQIDYLVITKKMNIVIECKNMIGNIEVNNNGDFIRTFDFGRKKKKEGIYSPITQNQRHLDVLKKIRRSDRSNFITKAISDKYFEDSYKSVVVLANPKTVINMKFAKKEVKEHIIRCDQLIDYIKKINKDSTNDSCSEKQMCELAGAILSHHTQNTTDYTKKYGVKEEEGTITVQNNTLENNTLEGNTTEDIKKADTVQSITLEIKEEVKKEMTPVQSIKENMKDNITSFQSTTTNRKEEISPIKDNTTEKLEDTQIYRELKQFRYDKSKAENVKAYIVYNNAQMEDIIKLMPKSLNDIKSISGFGDVKCNKYGTELLIIVNRNR